MLTSAALPQAQRLGLPAACIVTKSISDLGVMSVCRSMRRHGCWASARTRSVTAPRLASSPPPPWRQGQHGVHGVHGAELARFALSLDSAPRSPDLASRTPTCNQCPGVVTRLIRDHVMAVVEIQAGPHRIVSLTPVTLIDALQLRPRRPATAVSGLTRAVSKANPQPQGQQHRGHAQRGRRGRPRYRPR